MYIYMDAFKRVVPTAAVKPTPEEPRPVVEMARREVLSTELLVWCGVVRICIDVSTYVSTLKYYVCALG